MLLIDPAAGERMRMLVLDAGEQEILLERRRDCGSNRWDEVRDGLHIISTVPDLEHQDISSQFLFRFFFAFEEPRGAIKVRPGVNVSDRADDWEQNYRCPDVVVFLEDTSAQCLDTHYQGGPDFLIEIVSPGDLSREKIEF